MSVLPASSTGRIMHLSDGSIAVGLQLRKRQVYPSSRLILFSCAPESKLSIIYNGLQWHRRAQDDARIHNGLLDPRNRDQSRWDCNSERLSKRRGQCIDCKYNVFTSLERSHNPPHWNAGITPCCIATSCTETLDVKLVSLQP